MMRIALLIAALLAAFSGGFDSNAVRAQGVRPMGSVSQKSSDEAFATYVGWAAEEIRQRTWLELNVGLAEIPMGLQELPVTHKGFDDLEAAPRRTWSANRLTAENGITGVGLKMSFPAGFSYELHYGTGEADGSSPHFNGLKRSLPAEIHRVDVTHAYGGTFSWQTPVEGFTLRGGISQMHLKAGAVTLDAPLWSRAGINGNLTGQALQHFPHLASVRRTENRRPSVERRIHAKPGRRRIQ